MKSRIQFLRDMVEADPGGVSFQGQSAFDVADLVKQYFRDLPEPLFTSRLSETFLHIYQCEALPTHPSVHPVKVTFDLTSPSSSTRFPQRPAAASGSGGHLAAPRPEPGGAASSALLPAGRGVLCGPEPDDPHQRGRLPGAVALPPQHPQEGRQVARVTANASSSSGGSLRGVEILCFQR